MSEVEPMSDGQLLDSDRIMSDSRYDHLPIDVDIYQRLRARLDQAEAEANEAIEHVNILTKKGMEIAAERDALQAKYDALRDKLPKTADGVAIVPGTMLWTHFPDKDQLFGCECSCVGQTWIDTPKGSVPGGTLTFNVMNKSDEPYERPVYSTREAAEAASKTAI